MEKSEKSFYVIIENKKRGKFSGAGPIQVAKKVASKKLKSGKEMTFYLDEVFGKKKRYGPYQARKDKKNDQVVVVKARKVMKGGLLSMSDMNKLKDIFYNFNKSSFNRIDFCIKSLLPLIPFGREQIVYFYPVGNIKVIYKFAVFKEPIGNIWIMIYISDFNIDIIGFAEFFLNPYYSKYLDSNNMNLKTILEYLQNSKIIDSRTIREEARKINDILYIPILNKNKHKLIIYVPNYYQPFIRKCVYTDLTFGELDDKTSARIPHDIESFKLLESNYQRFLILTNTGINGISINEPIIYVRVKKQQVGMNTVEQINSKFKKINKEINEFQNYPKKLEKYNKNLNKLINNGQTNFQKKDNVILLKVIQNAIEELKEDKRILQSKYYSNYCIHTDPVNRRNLKIIKYNLQDGNIQLDIFDFTENIFKWDDINIICSILLGIPENFGRFKQVRRIANSIISWKNKLESKQTL